MIFWHLEMGAGTEVSSASLHSVLYHSLPVLIPPDSLLVEADKNSRQPFATTDTRPNKPDSEDYHPAAKSSHINTGTESFRRSDRKHSSSSSRDIHCNRF